MKKALILAAGVGKRLGNLTKEIPKCLLPIDLDNVLIDYSLEALKDNGIQEIIFVSGFAEDKLKDYVTKKWGNDFSCRFISNEKYSEYNNIYSAYLARDVWDDETILLNSDIIFHPDILRNIIASSGEVTTKQSRAGLREIDRDCFVALAGTTRNDMPPRSFLVIDNTKNLVSEDMKVKIDASGKIIEINKNLDIKVSFGEYIGITYLKGFERVKFLASLEGNIKNKKFDLYYEDALAHVLKEINVFPCSTQGKAWTEVDTKEDYELAKEVGKQI